jgi:GEVED domain/Dockerin type I domain
MPEEPKGLCEFNVFSVVFLTEIAETDAKAFRHIGAKRMQTSFLLQCPQFACVKGVAIVRIWGLSGQSLLRPDFAGGPCCRTAFAMNFLKKIGLNCERLKSMRSSSRVVRNRRNLLVENLESRRLMATLEVNTTSDLFDASDALISLREAIQLANGTADRDAIVFAESLTRNGPATIVLSGTELKISSAIEIVGPTSNPLTIDADHRSRVLSIDDGTSGSAEVKISNLRLVGGFASESGGAIHTRETLILIGCTIADSSAVAWGGGIFNGGILNIWESALFDNKASIGGAIMSHGILSIVDTTIAQNSVSNAGGGIYFDSPGSLFILINSTIAGNVAESNYGGVAATAGTVVRMVNTIVAGNTLVNGTDNDIIGFEPNAVSYSMIGSSSRLNWVVSHPSNIVGIDWKTVLENDGTRPILKDNGGRSQTIAILPGSRAIDSGYGGLFEDMATRTDQRGAGYSRVSRREVDMGAFERPRELTVVTITPSTPRYSDGTVVFTASVSAKDPLVTQIPTGSLKFAGYVSADRSNPIGFQNSLLVDGKSTWAFGESSYGVYRLEATYVGDDAFQGSEAPRYLRTGQIVDYGDAPSAAQSGFASSYPVTLDDDGARHSANQGYYLGKGVGFRIDGSSSEKADSDSNDDGIQAFTPLIVSSVPTIASFVAASEFNYYNLRDSKLDAWIDFNRDGDWNDPGEQIFRSFTLGRFQTPLTFTVPVGASVGQTGARFRVSSSGGLGPTGPAYDGEVEDYMVTLASDASAGMILNSNMTNLVSEVLVVNDETVLKGSSGDVLFRAPRSQASRVELDVSTSVKKIVNSLELTTAGKFGVELGATYDTIRLFVGNQTLSINRGSLSPDRQYAKIDITGSGNNTLNLNSALPRMGVRYDAGDLFAATWTRVDTPAIVDGRFVHQVGFASNSTIELDNPTPHLNPKNKYDADLDGTIAPSDVLATINALSRLGTGEMVTPIAINPLAWRYTDINGDGAQSPIDVLIQINELRRLSIPIPNYGELSSSRVFNFSSSSISTTGSGTWVVFDQSDHGYNHFVLSGIVSTGPRIQAVIPIRIFGSITVNPQVVINNPANMTVRGYSITINPYPILNGKVLLQGPFVGGV